MMDRWTFLRKAEIVKAIDAGKITFVEALVCYRLTHKELTDWLVRFRAGGVNALRMYR
jgi:Protein of unknown function (DUF1153)